MKNSTHWWTICGLGALDGLLVGFIIEALWVIYENHRIEVLLREAVEQNKMVGYMFNPHIDIQTPTVFALVFTGVSLLVYRYFMNRPRLLLLFWLTNGAFVLTLGFFVTAPVRNLQALISVALFIVTSYLVFRFWKSHLDSLPAVWMVIGISALLPIAAAVQIITMFTDQRFELRRPLTWLICLIVVLSVNFIFGTLLRLKRAHSTPLALPHSS